MQTGPDQWRAATKEETALLEKPRAVPGEKKEKTNPFSRYTQQKGPSTRSEAFAAIRKANPSSTSDAEINALS